MSKQATIGRTRPVQKHKAKTRGRGAYRSRRRARRFWAAGGGLVAALAIVALVVTGGGDSRPATRPVSVSGAALPDYGPANDPAVGRVAPDVTGETFDGDPIAIRADGTPKLVLFLAHWCPHCRKEVPVVQAWLQSAGLPQGVALYSVSTAVDAARENYPPQTWLEGEGWSVPVLVDSSASAAGRAYGITSYPAFVALDANNRVVARSSGELPVSAVEQLVARARAGG